MTQKNTTRVLMKTAADPTSTRQRKEGENRGESKRQQKIQFCRISTYSCMKRKFTHSLNRLVCFSSKKKKLINLKFEAIKHFSELDKDRYF